MLTMMIRRTASGSQTVVKGGLGWWGLGCEIVEEQDESKVGVSVPEGCLRGLIC